MIRATRQFVLALPLMLRRGDSVHFIEAGILGGFSCRAWREVDMNRTMTFLSTVERVDPCERLSLDLERPCQTHRRCSGSSRDP